MILTMTASAIMVKHILYGNILHVIIVNRHESIANRKHMCIRVHVSTKKKCCPCPMHVSCTCRFGNAHSWTQVRTTNALMTNSSRSVECVVATFQNRTGARAQLGSRPLCMRADHALMHLPLSMHLLLCINA